MKKTAPGLTAGGRALLLRPLCCDALFGLKNTDVESGCVDVKHLCELPAELATLFVESCYYLKEQLAKPQGATFECLADVGLKTNEASLPLRGKQLNVCCQKDKIRALSSKTRASETSCLPL